VDDPVRTAWIGGLAPGTTHEDLLPIMKTAGDCKRVQITSKNQGFAVYATKEDVMAAIIALNGAVVRGVEIQVDEYTSKK